MLIGIMFCIIKREIERERERGKTKKEKENNTVDLNYTDFGALCPNLRNYKIMKIF